MKKVEEKVLSFIRQNNLINDDDNILLALSGGPDSVFALHFLSKFLKKFKCKLAAVHINHQLRKNESDEDEVFVRDLCKKYKVDCFTQCVNVKKLAKEKKLSIEEAARNLRYSQIFKLAEEFSFNKIVTAHNLTDNTETILINLFSGAGIAGLSGIPIQRKSIIRPFLVLTKSEILDYLEKYRISYRIDSSNYSNDFKRNIIRNKILPLIREEINPSLDSALFRSSLNLLNQKIFEKKTIDFLISKFVVKKDEVVELKLSLVKHFGEIPGELLKHILHLNFSYQLEYSDYSKINSLVTNQKGKLVELKNGLKVYREKKSVIIKKETSFLNNEIIIRVGEKKDIFNTSIELSEADPVINLSKNKNFEIIDTDNLEDKFIVRKWKSGDYFKPIGMKKFKKVSDFLTDLKIPSAEKKNKLVLINRNQIIWIVGLRISDDVKITNKTKRALKLWAN